mmetsp:Transcript_23371/g.88730  ORF Transcript_23371/g.88730 Transcript_23371/m.88730 type:complete len:298 (-) Transcript_23371:601-1494(-)
MCGPAGSSCTRCSAAACRSTTTPSPPCSARSRQGPTRSRTSSRTPPATSSGRCWRSTLSAAPPSPASGRTPGSGTSSRSIWPSRRQSCRSAGRGAGRPAACPRALPASPSRGPWSPWARRPRSQASPAPWRQSPPHTPRGVQRATRAPATSEEGPGTRLPPWPPGRGGSAGRWRGPQLRRQRPRPPPPQWRRFAPMPAAFPGSFAPAPPPGPAASPAQSFSGRRPICAARAGAGASALVPAPPGRPGQTAAAAAPSALAWSPGRHAKTLACAGSGRGKSSPRAQRCWSSAPSRGRTR